MTFPNIRLREIYQLLHMIDADHFAGWPNLQEYVCYHLYSYTHQHNEQDHHESETRCKVTAAGAHVKSLLSRRQLFLQQLQGMSMLRGHNHSLAFRGPELRIGTCHVGCADGDPVADSLRGILVGTVFAIVCSIDCFHS